MTITEWLEEHKLRAVKNFNQGVIDMYKDKQLLFSVPGSELAIANTEEKQIELLDNKWHTLQQ
jgi:hypothetical protein